MACPRLSEGRSPTYFRVGSAPITSHRLHKRSRKALGPPLLATSAIAPSSNEPCRDAGEILEAFERYVDVVVDAEQTYAEPSTVLEIDGESVRLVRQGQGTIDDILTMVES